MLVEAVDNPAPSAVADGVMVTVVLIAVPTMVNWRRCQFDCARVEKWLRART